MITGIKIILLIKILKHKTDTYKRKTTHLAQKTHTNSLCVQSEKYHRSLKTKQNVFKNVTMQEKCNLQIGNLT